MAWRVTGSGNADHAGHDFSFPVDGLDLVAQRAKAAARHGVQRLLGGIGQAEVPQVGVGAGPEFPLQFGKNVAGVGESGAPAQVDRAANVVWMGVSQDHGIDILGAYAGHVQARLNGAGRTGVFACPGIDDHDMASGFDQQAGIRAEHGVLGQMMAFQFAAEIGGVGVGEEPGCRVRIVAVAENRAADGSDLEAVRALWHM